MQGIRRSEDVEHGRLNLIMGNSRASPVTKIGTYELILDSDVRFDFLNCCYFSEMTSVTPSA